MIRKSIWGLLAGVFVVSLLVLTACGDNETPTEPPSVSTTPTETLTETPSTTSTTSEISTTPATTTSVTSGPIVWTEDMDCSTCHIKYVDSMTDSTLLGYAHSQAGFGNCTDCHDVSTLEEVHIDVMPDDTYVKAHKYEQAFCLSCHGSLESLAALTVDSIVLTDINGTVVNPHDVPESSGHTSVTECYNCHKVHKTFEAINYCYACHHARVFECGTCHP